MKSYWRSSKMIQQIQPRFPKKANIEHWVWALGTFQEGVWYENQKHENKPLWNMPLRVSEEGFWSLDGVQWKATAVKIKQCAFNLLNYQQSSHGSFQSELDEFMYSVLWVSGMSVYVREKRESGCVNVCYSVLNMCASLASFAFHKYTSKADVS